MNVLSLQEKAKKIYTNRLKKINQPVTITDIVTRQAGEGTGQFKLATVSAKSQFTKMIKHLKLITAIANQYHQKENFDENNILKPNHENNVTRLMFHEFSFYTKKKPLSVAAFKLFIKKVEKLSSKLNENLFLLISSVPVLNPNNTVSNHVIHVQCGPLPKIEVLTKINPSPIDPVYPHTKNAKYSEERSNIFYKAVANTLLPNTNDNGSGIGLNYGRILRCETSGGAQFHTAIDICLDHARGEALRTFQREIEQTINSANNEPIPLQVSHVVTANSISFNDNNKIIDSIVRADPSYTYSAKNDIKAIPIPTDLMTNLPMLSKLQKQFPKMNFIQENNSIKINNPPFGPTTKLKVYTPMQLEHAKDDISNKITKHNDSLCPISLNQFTLFQNNNEKPAPLKETAYAKPQNSM